jgi:membrane fusion protein, peptide pheromone/bacteriocin exporter
MFPAPQTYFPSYSRTSIIYLSCIAAVVVGLALLPYLKTDISIRSAALIRPASEVNMVRSIATGRVKQTNLIENNKVKAGQLLYVLESETLNEQESFFAEKIELKEMFITDAEMVLATSQSISNVSFINAFYRQSYFAYRQRVSEAQTVYAKAKQAYDRQLKLYTQKVIAAAEFENFQFELDKASDALNQIRETQHSQWQNELKNLQDEKRELESQLVRVQKEKSMLTVHAPVSGTVQNVAGVYAGGLVFANQELAQISPDTNLLVIAYVQPNDIGFIKKDMPVRLQVDAFNYNQWGLANGMVTAVPQDIKIMDNKPVFEVRCSLDKDFLQLKNGYKGFLKKGMTLQARFIVTERTLWQLLYDKVDDWVNPNLVVSK